VAIPSPSADQTSPRAGRSDDAFDILGLEPRYDLDPALLAERHRALSLALHPDRLAGRPASERRLSLERSIEVNAAHRALRDPIERARILARRLGIPDEGEAANDLEFLERTMEQREALSDAVFARDQARILDLARRARADEAGILLGLRALFAAAEPGRSGPTLADLLSQLRFTRRFVESAEAELELDAR
jgi:molecular chaperone HscB